MVEFEEPVYGVLWEHFDEKSGTLFLIVKNGVYPNAYEVHTYDQGDFGLIFQDSFYSQAQAETYVEEFMKGFQA